jgi:hypothetical protein
MDERFRDLRGRHVDWTDIDRSPGGRDWQPPPKLHVVTVTVAPEPTPEPSAAAAAVPAPPGAVRIGSAVPYQRLDHRAEEEAAKPPVPNERGAFLWLKQAAAVGDWAAVKTIRNLLEGKVE